MKVMSTIMPQSFLTCFFRTVEVSFLIFEGKVWNLVEKWPHISCSIFFARTSVVQWRKRWEFPVSEKKKPGRTLSQKTVTTTSRKPATSSLLSCFCWQPSSFWSSKLHVHLWLKVLWGWPVEGELRNEDDLRVKEFVATNSLRSLYRRFRWDSF